MASLRKAVKKTLIETDTTKRLLEALTEHETREVYTLGTPKGREDWKDLKESLEALYETGEYTYDQLIEAALDMTDGEIDRYTARMLVDEIFA